ncbi:hypothetical protein G6F70_003099 [Rhizopus microsporus]|nr:hypothetical protein G6F71_003153 [Rhizopus microsporus]KAG1201511.1 hypothetical protein G6F70_003099 [Rhizopus microsporus]KAG1213474.1 hypothetical protein G6F69_002798 [Rhizopus microsporus]KAG1235466.1 hypothetical protein G6F67_002754 [Rhizopus microsporus]KAG1267496.1 hypothetical protein G6F68_001872 [Rhizopus microsporus]
MMRLSDQSDINQTEALQAQACVEWINSLDNISHSISHISELSDGIILFEILSTIDYKWFKLIRSADVGENWVFKINNLKKLYKLISRYYEDVLGYNFSNFPLVNLNAIAKEANFHEILKLCNFVIYTAVVCADNEKYIQKIQQLSPQSQQQLMLLIDNFMQYTQDNRQDELQQSSANYTPRSSYADDGSYQSELLRMSKEKEELEVQNRQLIDKHSELLIKYDKLEADRTELQNRLRDMDAAVAQANETGRADYIMRTEIEHLKQDLQRSEDIRQEQERRLEEQSGQIKELLRRSEDATKYEEQAIKLKDQLDEYRHTAEKLQKAENVIEKYKKKLEETADLRRQVKLLEERNHALLEHSQKLEEEYGSLIAFKSLMESYKDQVAELQTQNNELIREKNRLDYELVQATKKLELMEDERLRDSDRIQLLEDHLQEAQLGMGAVITDKPTTQRSKEVDADDMDIDDFNLNDSLEDTLKETNVTELKLANRRLERQVKKLQEEQAAGRSQKAVVLQHLLDDANRLKTQFEKSYIEVSQERDILQSDMARIREGIPDALVDQSAHTLSLRLHTIELEKEIKSLRETVAKLEKKIEEGRFNDAEGAEDIRTKYYEMEQKSKHLEEQTKKQLEDINKLLLEKDALQGRSLEQNDELREQQRLNSEMKASLAAYAAQNDEPLKQQNAHLQQQAIQLQEQLREAQLKLKKAKEFIKQQDKLLKEQKYDGNSGNFDEAVSSLKAEVALREEETEKLKKQIHELRLQSRREQHLIISAWYDMSRRATKDIIMAKAFPNSWLGQQRYTLDNQLKRR